MLVQPNLLINSLRLNYQTKVSPDMTQVSAHSLSTSATLQHNGNQKIQLQKLL